MHTLFPQKITVAIKSSRLQRTYNCSMYVRAHEKETRQTEPQQQLRNK